MTIKGNLFPISIAIIAIANLLYFYSLTKTMSIYGLFLSLLLIYISWFFGKKYDELIERYKELEDTNKVLTQDKLTIQTKYNDYDQFFNNFDASTFFIYDYKQRNYKFSKGVEKLFGYTQNDFNTDKDFVANLKHSLHPGSIAKFESTQNSLLLGNPVREELRIVQPDNMERWVLFIANPIKNNDGLVEKINGEFEDITRQKELELELRHMAFFDELTDIPNRKMLDRQVQKALSRSKRQDHNFTLMFIDLDDFKKVNDTYGHDIGDLLLKEVVLRINDCIREEDLISRIGGDEFIVMFEETNKDEIEDIAKRIIDYVGEPYSINGNEASISLSIGISMYPDDGEDKETLIKAADKAMYHAKNSGKNNYKLYTHDLDEIDVTEKGIFKKWMEVIQSTFK